MQELHDKEFQKTDCLTCGNCCKTTSPIFTDTDTARISKHLKMKVVDFQNKYLERDTDDFMVLKTAPCSFFDTSDNTCSNLQCKTKSLCRIPAYQSEKVYTNHRFNHRKHNHLSSRLQYCRSIESKNPLHIQYQKDTKIIQLFLKFNLIVAITRSRSPHLIYFS